ncbi:hypothetical protein BG74_08990 [Sodalis-like endosymbiont of Proechinophthirus fluctus]|uniref:hypothetical protein n=1 Tax=Sodalis-like endosymbiont of Proechinophthirus fluctus TaxID=1462730 RepID=UPI0007A870B8|nr:hypothetical protein [Sodalis-like endosymbiont of Proechinophthirus fluctus]KYP95422.1 hypothetical protein BG74_08990 [Sodalis-like endosymbiont of Proechinophthirus fluctus]
MGLCNALAGALLTAPFVEIKAGNNWIMVNIRPDSMGIMRPPGYLHQLLAPDDRCPLSPSVGAWLTYRVGGDLFCLLYRQKGLFYQCLGIQPAASDIGTLLVKS